MFPPSLQQIALIDATLPDWQALAASLPDGTALKTFTNLAELSQWASAHAGEYSALHLFGHGAAGMLQLGSDALNTAKLGQSDVQAQLRSLGQALTPDGDLLLYGCDVAQGQTGSDFIGTLANLTQADVTASTNLTGMHGDWTLEAVNGVLQTSPLAPDWQGDLAMSITPVRMSYPDKAAGEFRNSAAFAALKSDGSVVTWGYAGYGGDSSAVVASLSSGVSQIYSTPWAFAALKSDGSVVTWGDSSKGGDSSAVTASLSSGVSQIYSTYGAFAALKSDGSVVTWGDSSYGADSSAVTASLSSGVSQIYSAHSAFAALKSDGSVVTWGDPVFGGDSSAVVASLSSGVSQIYSTEGAFAALKSDGSVVTWGDSSYGGDSSAVVASLSSGVSQIYSAEGAFAALKSDGSVVTWGDPVRGGDSSAVTSRLASGVSQIYSSTAAFAALKSDGSVVTWGSNGHGGDSSAVTASLSSGVSQIYSTTYAFAALKSDGSVVTWGDGSSSGDSSAVAASLSSGVSQIYSASDAFAALKSDGSVVTWGRYYDGGNSSAVAASLSSGVSQIYATHTAFAALKSDGSVVTWGGSGDSSAVASGVVGLANIATDDRYSNSAPTHIALSHSSVAENTSTAGALTIGALSSTDPDAGNTFTYSIVGGIDQAQFQVSGANLQFKAGTTLDYETQSSYAVTVRSTDQGGLTYDKTLTVSLSNVNEKPLISSPAAQNVTQGVATALTGISLADPDAGSGLLSLSVSGEPAVFNASNGGGVTVSGAGSPSITLTGSQANLNAFIAAGRLTATTPAGMAGPFTITLDSDDNGLSGAGGAKQDSKTLTLNGVAASVVSPPSSGDNSHLLYDGVEVTLGSVWRADGSTAPSVEIPVISASRIDQDPSSPNADIPLAGSSSAPAIKAEIPTGIGMTSIGGDSTKTDKTDLITAIKSRTVDKSADQNSMVDLGKFFLKTLPNSADLWVRTVVISADSSKDAAGSLVLRGQTSDSNTDTALVLDFSNLPKNSKVSTENIHFAAVVGEVTITTGDGNQLLIADNKAQTLDLGAGNDTVYAGAGNDVLNNSKGNDKLFGQGGNDTFNAENGQNTLHGGADSDTAKFTGKRADYTVERHDGYVKVINNADTSKSTLVVNTETLQFADSSETLQARDELKVLAGSYLQVLGRQADVYGFDYFGDLQSKGYSLGGIAINMIKSDEAKARGFVLTGDAVNDVEMLYKAILGRESDAGGKAAWVQQMQANGMTLEQVANAFMVSGEMQKHYLVQTGWDFLL